MNDNKNTAAAESHPSILEATATIATAYATAFYDNAAKSLEAVGHIAKLPHDPNFMKAASDELVTLQAETTARGAAAHQIASEAVDEIKAKFGG